MAKHGVGDQSYIIKEDFINLFSSALVYISMLTQSLVGSLFSILAFLTKPIPFRHFFKHFPHAVSDSKI